MTWMKETQYLITAIWTIGTIELNQIIFSEISYIEIELWCAFCTQPADNSILTLEQAAALITIMAINFKQ